MKKALSIILSLGAMGVILVGIPALLCVVGRFDLLFTINWGAIFQVPDDGSLVLLAFTVIAWGAWTLIAASLITELIEVVTSGRVRLRIPGTRWLRPLSALLVASSIGLLASASPQGDKDVTSPALPVQPSATSESNGVGPTPAEQESNQTPRPSSPHSYIVQPGDDLWSLSERFLGTGARWREIFDMNSTVLLSPTAELDPGSALTMPAEAKPGKPPEGDIPSTRTRMIVVAEGESLWSIAERELGDGSRWRELYDLNRSIIANPDRIDVGWRLRVPDQRRQPPGETSSRAETAPQQESTQSPSGRRTEVPFPDIEAPVTQPQGNEEVPAEPQPQAPAEESVVDVDAEIARRVGAIGSALALTLGGLLIWRRRRQLNECPIGQKIPLPKGAVADSEQALAVLAAQVSSKRVNPTSVTLGWQESGDNVIKDLELSGLTIVDGEKPHVSGVLAAMAGELIAEEVSVLAVGESLTWLETLDHASLTVIPELEDGHAALQTVVAERIAAAQGRDLRELRANPDAVDAWAPMIVIFDDHVDLAPDLLDCMRQVGVSAVCAGKAVTHAGVTIICEDDRAMLLPEGTTFHAQMITPPVQETLAELFDIAESSQTTPAPWWCHDDEEASEVELASLAPSIVREESIMKEIDNSEHPKLFMLGPVGLEGARGQLPGRAVKQCVEYCGWILHHPGATASTMTSSLLVAETTRRSNMSRLRTWLGRDAHGELYLPDAYSGRITLHPGVSSDWEHFLMLVSGGVNRAADANLRSALSLVRGAPLADAAPGQWHWAEELRIAMVSTIRDAGTVLAERCLEQGDIDGARWAAARALTASPEDERLMAVRIKTEHQAGNHFELERLVMHVTRHARMVGVDLSDDMVALLQKVMEGGVRNRTV